MDNPPLLSVVIPAYNEQDNIQELADELAEALAEVDFTWETVWVDDGSTDATRSRLRSLPSPHRFIAFGQNTGQSAALYVGFRETRGAWVATLDADGQNDPRDLPRLLQHAVEGDADMVNGVRGFRRDRWLRRISSRIANSYRRFQLDDGVTDVGCSTRVMRRRLLVDLPFFNGMHRYLPALIRARGGRIAELNVNHRPRQTGVSKYGVQNRLWIGLRDVAGVKWLLRRQRLWEIAERQVPSAPREIQTPHETDARV